MGKKSKKKAAKAPPLGGSSTACIGTKNARCFACSGTVKLSEGKGHTCVGCSGIYCHRCEKKKFLACSNDKECLHPVRRCPHCIVGLSLLCEMGIVPKRADLSLADTSFGNEVTRSYAELGGDLQHAIVPFVGCDDCAEVHTIECFKCASSPKPTRLRMCNGCKLWKCFACNKKLLEAMENILLSVGESFDAPTFAASEFCPAAEERLVQEVPSFLVGCSDCSEMTCVTCLEGNGLERFTKGLLNNIPFFCDTCYYAKKPCTNPSCPNEVGVPTKRCGGCHISRYCSKECQAADYLEHEAKCERMQEKLAANISRASTM